MVCVKIDDNCSEWKGRDVEELNEDDEARIMLSGVLDRSGILVSFER